MICSTVAEPPQVVEDVFHHRLAGDLEHRLRRDVRVRAQARAFAGERDDHLHDASLRVSVWGRGVCACRQGALVPSRP